MKYYIIAGEASGDLHASNLMKELSKLDEEAEFRCWGGDRMEERGGTLVKHYRELAFMGFTEVIINLRTILKNISYCKKDISRYNPDVVILVDYPGFNFRIAEFTHSKNIKTFYYISPQIWAWKQSRVHKVKKWVDHMFVILPFEKSFYNKFNVEVDFVGHPLLDAIEEKEKISLKEFNRKNNLNDKQIIALLPGSRKQEISRMLPIMLSLKENYPEYQFVIAGAPSQDKGFYEQFVKKSGVHVVFKQTYDLLQNARAAVVTSGTATLEAGLFEVPQVVCYKGGKISYYIARVLVKVDFISLVNLVMKKEVVTELIQNDLNAKQLKKELDKLLYSEEHRNFIKEAYKELKIKLGGKGASKKAASLMHKYLSG